MKTLAWPLSESEIQDVVSRLRFDYSKWDVYTCGELAFLPECIVLSREEHKELVEVSQDVWSALRELEKAIINEPELLIDLGIPAPMHEAIQSERSLNPRISRCDFHYTTSKEWVISEFNEDTPAGVVESAGISTILNELYSQRFESLSWPGDIEDAICSALSPYKRIGMAYATAYSEDLQHISLISKWLANHGHSVVSGSPANLAFDAGSARIFSDEIDAIFRFFPGEFIADLPNFTDWAAASHNLPMLNGLSALVAQSKSFYAVPFENENLELSTRARELIETNLPRSIYLKRSFRDQLILERDRWVIKGVFGRMGKSVRLGSLTTLDEWILCIDEALKTPEHFVLQEHFEAEPLWFSAGLRHVTVGVFLVDGIFAGYYSRAGHNPVINYNASSLSTVVEV